MCEGRTMSNRNSYSHTVIREIGCIKAQLKKWPNERTKKWTKPCANQSSKFLTALTLVFAGALYAGPASADFWSKAKGDLQKGAKNLGNVVVTAVQDTGNTALKAVEDIKREAGNIELPPPPTTLGGVATAIIPGAPIILGSTGNGTYDQGPVTSGVNGALTLAVKASTLPLELCGDKVCDAAKEKLEKAVEAVTGPEALNRTEEDVKEGLSALGEVWSAGQNGRNRDIERGEEGKSRVEDGRKHAEELRSSAMKEVDIEMAHLTSQLQRQEHMIKQLKSIKLTGERHNKAIDELAEKLEKGTAVYDTLVAVVNSQNSDLQNWVKNLNGSEFETDGMVSNLSLKLQDYVTQIDQMPREESQIDDEILSKMLEVRERLMVDLNAAIESMETSNIDLKKSVAEAEKRRASL